MNILSVSKLQKEFNGEVLFKNISFEINSGDKIALIGKNGTGKSTLIKMIIGDIREDDGTIFINNKAHIGYLSQDIISNQSKTLYEEMLEVFKDVTVLESKINSILHQIEKEPTNNELLTTYSNMQHHYEILGGYEYQYKIDMILSKFGFSKEEYKRVIQTFSGGEKTRVAFAKLLLQEPDLLILDEPTNHLDIEIIEWLEDYLNKYNGAVMVVTHDKYFISKVCKKIIEIDHKTAQLYTGSYENYEEEKIKRYEILVKQYKRQQKEINHLQSFVDRFKYNSKRASLAKDREKKIARIDKIEKPHVSNRHVNMNFDTKRVTRDIILKAKNLTVGYDTPLVENVTFSMRGFDKLAIIGPNGTGKTTLLKVIEQKLKPLGGKIEFLRHYTIGYFDQNQSELNYNKTIFEEIHDYYPMFTNYDIRNIAARFLFYNEDLDKPISILSGGERVRLVLLLLMLKKPDLLILDEPTNHLDIETKDIIEDVFNEFTGPVIFVSHDRYFINRIGTKLLYLNDGDYTLYSGSYDDFKEYQNSLIVKREKVAKQVTKPKTKNKKKMLDRIEKEIHQLEESIQKKEEDSFKEEFYTDANKLRELTIEIEEHRNKLEDLLAEYFILDEE